MIEMTNKQWELVLEKHQEKIDKIKELESELDLEKEEFDSLAEKTSELLVENEELEIENEKLMKKLTNQEYTIKLILNKLNESLNIMELHGLKTKRTQVQASALDLLV